MGKGEGGDVREGGARSYSRSKRAGAGVQNETSLARMKEIEEKIDRDLECRRGYFEDQIKMLMCTCSARFNNGNKKIESVTHESRCKLMRNKKYNL